MTSGTLRISIDLYCVFECELGGVGFQGVTRIEQVEFTRLMQNRFCWGRAQHKKDEDCLPAVWGQGSTQGQWQLSFQPSPRSHMTQFLTVCLWHLPSHCFFARAQAECLQVLGSVRRPYKRVLGFLVAFRLSCMMEFLLNFTARCCGASSSQW